MTGFKVGDPCSACCTSAPVGQICVTVTGCGSVVSGATVTVTQGATTIGSATTSSLGKACVNIYAAGSYTLTVTPPAGSACNSYQTYTTTGSYTTGTNNVSVFLANSTGWQCCSGSGYEVNWTGNITLNYTANSAPPFTGCYRAAGTTSSGCYQWIWYCPDFNGGEGFLTYLGNCQWQLSGQITSTVYLSTIITAPPVLPISLTFTSWLGSNPDVPNGCTTYPTLPITFTS